MKKKDNINTKLKKYFYLDNRTIGFFFLGVGITIFMLSLIIVETTIKLIVKYHSNVQISTGNFYLTIISSIIIMLYSLYNIYEG